MTQIKITGLPCRGARIYPTECLSRSQHCAMDRSSANQISWSEKQSL